MAPRALRDTSACTARALKHRKHHDTQLNIPVPEAVSVTWQLSFDAIRKHHSSSFKLLSPMSLLHNDDMPDFLFIGHFPKYGGDRSLFEKDITPLLRFSLDTIA
ncbi:hypothetical protein QBC46DRAFT_94985 [Diplogelasinospora grovesii]|uniref:Uncharacterized protein n=1 Tax=Diplogelasinospora grovesii TaxID=303347 RepID=A0AAN6NGZ4_9PEZI|nr:hypothetical protein QBC46DRAFT_94985 [Diplogelasinospora grovesii]